MLDPEQWGLFSYATCNTTITTDPTTNNTITEQTVKVGAIVGQFVNCYFHRNRRHPAGADIAGIATPNITAGQAEEVYIESYDYCGQPLGFGGSPRAFIVEVTLETQSANPGASFNVTPVDNSDGSYTATVPLNISGTYSVALVIYDAFVSQSNYRITVLPGMIRIGIGTLRALADTLVSLSLSLSLCLHQRPTDANVLFCLWW